jgi:hypothetical protein
MQQGKRPSGPGSLLLSFRALREQTIGTKCRASDWKKEKKQISYLLRDFSSSEILYRMEGYFADGDKFLEKNAWPLGLFLHNFDKYSAEITGRVRSTVERNQLNETPGREREAKVSAPKSMHQIINELEVPTQKEVKQ